MSSRRAFLATQATAATSRLSANDRRAEPSLTPARAGQYHPKSSTPARTARRLVPCLAVLVCLAAPASAREAQAIAPTDTADPRQVAIAPHAQASPFVLRSTDVRAVITGPVAHVTVTQEWKNPNAAPVDGLYIFPLPPDAAVTDMSLRVGERWIRSQMHRRDEARAIYEQARRDGKVAGLLDQERANVFVQQVANLMPGEAIDVVIEMDHPVRCESATCEYVFPTVVGPRFVPAEQADPGRIDPPVVAAGGTTRQRLTFGVELAAGVSISDITSPSHRIRLSRDDDAHARVEVIEGTSALVNRDFRLRWKVGGDTPEIGLLTWRDPRHEGDEGVFTLLLQPPRDPADEDAAPRELVFVLDCSGSMRGVPIEAAKKVVRQALVAVRPQDTFQIIRFSERASGLGPAPLAPTPDNLARALVYLDALEGSGGTRMIEGIRASLDRPADPGRLRIVAFLTDGFIGNENEILAQVRRVIGEARLFSFGIGSSVNRYLLEGLAEEGRGVAAFLGGRESPDEMVSRFVARIATPVLTDVRVMFEDVEVFDMEPARVPDLFAGQAVLIHGRYRNPGIGLVVVEGRRRGRWETLSQVCRLPAIDTEHAALGRLWARARIHRLQRELHGGMREEVRVAITDLGLRHHLLTPWTSLVAVDSLVSNLGGPGAQVQVPVEMPEDMSYQATFGVTAGRKIERTRQAVPAVTTMSLAPAAVHAAPTVSDRLRSLGYVGRSPEQEAGNGRNAGTVPTGKPKQKTGGGSPRNEISLDDARRGLLTVMKKRSQAGSTPRGKAAGDAKELAETDLPVAGSAVRGDANEAAASFARLILLLPDGLRITVEADGSLWRADGGRLKLVRTLEPDAMVELERLLNATAGAAWKPGPGSGATLTIETASGSRVLVLPEGGAAVSALLSFLTRQSEDRLSDAGCWAAPLRPAAGVAQGRGHLLSPVPEGGEQGDLRQRALADQLVHERQVPLFGGRRGKQLVRAADSQRGTLPRPKEPTIRPINGPRVPRSNTPVPVEASRVAIKGSGGRSAAGGQAPRCRRGQ